jgi:DNA sulfur modification protein DndE
MIDSIRLTNTEKDLLIRIKRKTGIDSWNIICRWALLVGLSQNTFSMRKTAEKRDAIEIKWDTFTGNNSIIYSSLVSFSFSMNAADNISINDFFHAQLETGIRILSTKCNDKKTLVFMSLASD